MTRRLIAAATIVLFLTALVGCETMSQDEKATMGGLGAGAVVGTLAGLAFGQGAGIAIAGGMIGAAAGGIIGHYAFGKNEDHQKRLKIITISRPLGRSWSWKVYR